jgi:D-alanyl-D-alanine carboxypeptidase (penicillin-binding protein 5/6)
MKRLTLCVLFLVLLTPAAMAARAPLSVVSRDPYVSALVIDADSGKTLFEENADAKVYPASVLKLMNLYVILDRIEQGTLKLDEMVQVTPEAAKIGGSQVYLDPKEQFPVEELIYALMVQSANDAAVALATHIAGSKEGFIALMNQKAQELGMKNSVFHSVHGLPPSAGQQPDITTARDLAILCRELAKRPEALKYTGTQSRGFRDDKFMMHNHNKLLTRVPGCDGFKTGYYEAAGFSVAATAKKGGVRIITLVMGSKDRKVRDAKAAELLGKGFSLVPPRPETAIATAPKPAAPQPQPTAPAAVVDNAAPAAPPAATAPAAEAAPQGMAAAPPARTGDGGWGKLLLGIGIGFLLFLAFFAVAGFLSRRRASSIRSKHKTLG